MNQEKTHVIRTTREVYVSPVVDSVTICIESGFAASGEGSPAQPNDKDLGGIE